MNLKNGIWFKSTGRHIIALLVRKADETPRRTTRPPLVKASKGPSRLHLQLQAAANDCRECRVRLEQDVFAPLTLDAARDRRHGTCAACACLTFRCLGRIDSSAKDSKRHAPQPLDLRRCPMCAHRLRQRDHRRPPGAPPPPLSTATTPKQQHRKRRRAMRRELRIARVRTHGIADGLDHLSRLCGPPQWGWIRVIRGSRSAIC